MISFIQWCVCPTSRKSTRPCHLRTAVRFADHEDNPDPAYWQRKDCVPNSTRLDDPTSYCGNAWPSATIPMAGEIPQGLIFYRLRMKSAYELTDRSMGLWGFVVRARQFEHEVQERITCWFLTQLSQWRVFEAIAQRFVVSNEGHRPLLEAAPVAEL